MLEKSSAYGNGKNVSILRGREAMLARCFEWLTLSCSGFLRSFSPESCRATILVLVLPFTKTQLVNIFHMHSQGSFS